MVVPSDRFCIENGYYLEFEQYGKIKKIPDYQKALQSDEKLRLAISQMGMIMAERDFPLRDLETQLKRLDSEVAEASLIVGKEGGIINESPIDILKRTAKADIILDLDFSIKEAQLGMNYANFNLKGIDAYTGKIIAVAIGSSKPFMTEQTEVLLQMAVKDYMESFNDLLIKHFEDLFENGREISIQIKMFDSSSHTFYDEFSYDSITDELSYIIEEYFSKNTVKGRFSVEDITETNMRLSQLRIPLYDDRGRAIDARGYMRGLRKLLSGEPFHMDSRIYTRGLGEVWLIIGEK
ncbi:hypothetical protein ElyMa_002236800 [Elysia marginata]|uniref:Uncharacterized protein n=1 Tax=Elysia marginata TaxID=1093978 RepID=A0AAV4FYI3_9GAST|nr:hypothetical protein ElyMa_002236800 [Elysia marginata]